MKPKKKPSASAPGRTPALSAASRAKPRATQSSRKVPTLPPLLLEGDAPSTPPPTGPGQRYLVGPGPAPARPIPVGELPEAYGTQTLLLTARDPYWLYAHWDLDRHQLKKYNSLSGDRHLILRVYQDALAGEPLDEIHVHPESRNWFIPVGRAGAKFLVELGYYTPARHWHSIAVSRPTLTPPDRLSDDTSARFATIPIEVAFEELLQQVEAAVRENLPLAQAVLQARAEGRRDLPDAKSVAAKPWTPAQQRALAKILNMDEVRRVWVGSLEITELIRRQMAEELSSAAAAQFGRPELWSGALSSISSPLGAGGEQPKSFWFNVNAELIIYGATQPDAKVSIGKRTIKLRPDGTFSYRFALPDGKYDLGIAATANDGTDTRKAQLEFSRQTEYRGEVGAHPQDAQLRRPHPENVA